ncbi:aldehyde dehydrogenase family protein [Alteribacter keqinensis]|uniref:Aldehyde dehydrogenase family protein n=1 Tax=Alteribacter keqinensis TaxID=2483800 RepID=A0A3M7TUB8_9BACI|nr:aldehyde dehydrogenase family protein [Alteribacter keqinensis]RNA69230.1 aldehyde dehydrogenase family protein [Alteribacter keqinensis]
MDMKKKLFIGGEWVEGSSYKDLLSPYDREVVAQIPSATEKETEQAVVSAFKARKELGKLPAHQRAEILDNVSRLLEERREEAARLISQEAAKPIQTARTEVARSIMTYKFASEEARRIKNEMINMDAAPGGEGRIAYAVREPAGVVAAITPFNFPMNLVAHKLGPAIAAGNPVILKPASQTPLSAYFIAEIFEKAGLPKGALNVITGKGSVVGEKLVTDDRISVITFTGSPEVGIALRNKAGLKKMTLELGSNSAVIIDEGVNVEEIADRLVLGSFAYQGQVCISLQRIFVHESLKQEVIDAMKKRTDRLIFGHPLDEATDISALISEDDCSRVLSWIDEAKDRGAEVVCGGTREGNGVLPTILADVPTDSSVSCEEVFGPVVHINSFSDWDQAIIEVNSSDYGLQAGVFTNDMKKAFQAAEDLEVGGVLINDIPTFRVDHMPYGGVKKSGFGREGIKYAIEEMTELKLVSFKK